MRISWQHNRIRRKAQQQQANQQQWAGTDFYEDVIEFNYAIDDITVDASGNLAIKKDDGQIVVNTEVPAILSKAPEKAVIVQDKNGGQYVVRKDKTTGQTKVTKVDGGGLSPQTIQDNQIKNALVVLVLEQFAEEVDAWLRVNGKGGEDDDEVLLAQELPEAFPKEAIFLELLKDRVIPGFKEHPEKLVTKTEAEQSNKELLDRVSKLFKTKADIDWKKIENNDQQSVRNVIAKSLVDLSGGDIDLAAVANIAPDCGQKHAGKDKPNGSLYLIRYAEECGYFRGSIVAKYILEGHSKYLCAKERFNLIKCLATNMVDGNDENSIITLIKETPREHAGSLLSLFKADNTGVLKNINSGVDGDNYITVFKAIQQVYLTATEKVQIDAEVNKIDDAFLADKSRAEKAKLNYFTWFEGGVLKSLFSDDAVFSRFDNVAIANNGIVSFKYATDPAQHDKTTTPISIEPFKLVGLKVVGGSNEVANAAQGSTVYIPAIMLPVLISKRETSDFFEALNATMVASGVGSIVTGATRFVIVSGGIDVLLGSSALVVDNYKEEISRMKHGEDFLDAYILVNKAMILYFGSKTILQLTGALPKLKNAFVDLKNSDDFVKLKATNPTKANKIAEEVEKVVKKGEDLNSAAILTRDGFEFLSKPIVSGDNILWEITFEGKKISQTASIKNGIIEFDFRVPQGLKSGCGEKMLDEAILLFESKNVKGVKAIWGMHPDYPDNMSLGLKQYWDNYEFMEGTLYDESLELYAARNTRLGKLMKERGFTEIVFPRTPLRDEVEVIFSKK